ncbi:heat shock 70 kDa protein 12A-like [Saccostrea echinata]|uniref:heat shock 70 kDa protein 12A-like n=1 Tax=Saccostrea echinata TaxID=191078 RepID=UPI002A8329C7|nr:heat shock 70 kDa protein 12A-like [Saccostrea echinata]
MDPEETNLKFGIQVSEMSLRNVWDIVVAFDIGTSYSGYAYCDRKEINTKSISLNQWTGNMVPDPKAKAPTTVLVSKNKSFHSFGYEAEEFYAQQVCKKNNEDWYRFRNFKMVLYRETNVQRNIEIKDDSGRLSLPALEIFAWAIQSLKVHFETTIKDRSLTFDKNNILYVITVPAIWKQSAKLFMKEAALKAGILEAQLLIALEPEAAAMYCKSLPDQTLTETFKPNKRYMVLDLGGGTADVVVHDVLEDGRLAEVYKASGGDWGGTTVDKEFEKYIKIVFNSESCLQQLWECAPRDAFDMEREFEMQKRQISNAPDGNIRLKLPGRLKMFGQISVKDSVTFDHLYVENSKFKEFFEEAKIQIISLIKRILRKVKHLDQILLVGGFSCSRYLCEQIKSHSDFSKIKFCCPKEPGLAVLQGAVMFGYHPEEVKFRICRYTYGIGVLQDFDESIHPKEKRDIVDGEVVCKDIFDVLVHEGDRVKYDEPKVSISKSSHKQADRKQIPIRKEIYAGKNIKKDGLTYVTDQGIKSIGKITNQPPVEGWPDLVNFETKVYFGQTEIKVEDFDTTNKVSVKAEFDLI